MTTKRLQVLVGCGPGVAPVVDALARLHHDIGSVDARKLDASAPPGRRLLTVALADAGQLELLAAALRRELAGQPEALQITDRCIVVPLPLDTCIVVFLDAEVTDLL